MGFIITLETLQNGNCVGDRGLVHFDFLKSPAKCFVALKRCLKFRVGGRANTAQFTTSQDGFENVRSVHGAALDCPGFDNRVDFVDEQDHPRLFLQFLDHRFETLLKLASVFRAGQQGSHIEGVDLGALEWPRHFTTLNFEGQALGNRSFTHPRFAHVDRIIFAAPA